ncbi:hypothetical protein [Treponema sp. UBA6852]|uniref:hypothetical protein n=1 Tax=Treponema sp. UBA6852 TaxID=1947744 RepID=UPI0025D671DB|nr:hypothetical protein [Treponema sp. UBA6852]
MEHKEYQVVWKKKIDKQIKKLPADVKNRFLLLARDLRKKERFCRNGTDTQNFLKIFIIATLDTAGARSGIGKKRQSLWR